MILFGGGLKLRERITARFGDVLSWLYLATAVLRRYEADGCLKEDQDFVHWSMQYALHNMQVAFLGLFKNMGPLFGLAAILTRINTLGSYPKDSLSTRVAKAVQVPGDRRDRLTAGMYISSDENNPVTRLEHALKHLYENRHLYLRLRKAVKSGVAFTCFIRKSAFHNRG